MQNSTAGRHFISPHSIIRTAQGWSFIVMRQACLRENCPVGQADPGRKRGAARGGVTQNAAC
jgi:hypothetical protein